MRPSTPCRPHVKDRRALAYQLSLLTGLVLVVGMGAVTWGRHGVLGLTQAPASPAQPSWGLFWSIVLANAVAVSISASGLLTAGVGTVLMGPVVSAHIAILLATGQSLLSPRAFGWGLAIHGGGEAVAVGLGCAAGFYPLLRTLLKGGHQRAGVAARYRDGVAEALPLLLAAYAVVLAAAAWETLVSTRLR